MSSGNEVQSFKSVHCDPEPNFLPGIPSGKVVDSTGIERSLCDSVRPRRGGGYNRLAYETQEETTDNDVGKVLTELQNPATSACGSAEYGGVASYRSQSRDQPPCDGHKSEIQPRGRDGVHDQVRGHLHLDPRLSVNGEVRVSRSDVRRYIRRKGWTMKWHIAYR